MSETIQQQQKPRKARPIHERWMDDTAEVTLLNEEKNPEKKVEKKADAVTKATPQDKLIALTNDKGKIPTELIFGHQKHDDFNQDDPPKYKLPWQVGAVTIKSLIPTQKNVDSEKINHMINRVDKKFEYPLIIRENGKLYILDGHHRITTEWLEGKEVVDVEIADSDTKVDSIKADAVATINAPEAAGILFIGDNGKILLGCRANYGNYPLHWGVFGGHRELKEPLEATARREVLEETGYTPDDPVQLIAQTNINGVTFSYFMSIGPCFDVVLNDEHVSYDWFPMGEVPEPMHPGIDGVLEMPEVIEARKRKMNETDVAKAMALGALSSPQRFVNMSMYKMRISGTGTSFRKGYTDKETGKKYKDEHVYRRPENYLTPDFLERCYGLNVIWEHPEGKILDSEEFHERVIGTIVVPYIQGDEVWGIARVYDDDAIVLLDNERLSTSPAVVFQDSSVNSTIALNDGSQLLIEGNPSLLDHLAVCEIGVWDKDGPPTGIESDIQ
jgi:8-oxo-dGTP pyrophosphatase MutT (NUDIX family)